MLRHGKSHLAELWWVHRATLSQSIRIRQKLWEKGVGKLPDSTAAHQPHLGLLWVLCQWKFLNSDFKKPSKKKKKRSCFLLSRAQAAQDVTGEVTMVPPALIWDSLLASTTLSDDPEYILTCKNPTKRSWAIAATHRCQMGWATAPSCYYKRCTVTLFWSQPYHSANGHLIWFPLAGSTSTAWNAFVLRQTSCFS